MYYILKESFIGISIFQREDGHLRVYIMGRAVTGIGHVVVYKPPPKKEKPKKPSKPPAEDPVAI